MHHACFLKWQTDVECGLNSSVYRNTEVTADRSQNGRCITTNRLTEQREEFTNNKLYKAGVTLCSQCRKFKSVTLFPTKDDLATVNVTAVERSESSSW